MKVDLITILPKVAFETYKEKEGKLVRDYGAINEIFYLGAHIGSYKRLISEGYRYATKSQIVRCINQTHRTIVDASKQTLDDYIVVVDQNIVWDDTGPPNPASVDLITYFLNLKELDAYLGLDFGKVVLFPKGREDRYVNNRLIPWDKSSPWVLPFEQKIQVKVRLDQKVEGVLKQALCTVQKNRAKEYKQVMIAIGLFNQSCRLSLFHRNSSLVLIVSALEALFNIPNIGRKKEVFAYAIQVHWGFDENINKWADRLYEFRNRIIHGADVGERELKASSGRYYSDYEIARKMFDGCLKLVLELHGGLSISPHVRSAMTKRLLGLLVSNKKKIENIIELSKQIIRIKWHNPKRTSLFREFLETITVLDPEDDSAKRLLVSYLKAVFSVVRSLIESEKEEMASLPESNTKYGIKDRMPYYDKVAGILGQMETTTSWSNGKLSEAGRKELDGHIRALIEATTELRGLASGARFMYGVGLPLDEFISKCLRAINILSNL